MPRPPIVDHCLELLSPLGPVRTRPMFGGWGLWADDLFVALIAYDRLYLKVHEATEPAFVAAGCEAFVYHARGRDMTLSFRAAPDDALESPALMRPWAQLALQAAVAARGKQPTARRGKTPVR